MGKILQVRLRGIFGAAVLALAVPGTVMGTEQGPELEDAMTNARTKGDHAVAVIMDRFGDLSGATRHTAIRSLAEARTDKARNALLDIAMAKHGDEWVEWAATNYVLALENKADARKLLAAKRWQVQQIGLLGLCGCPVDMELFAELQTILEADSFALRRAAGSVIKEDTANPGVPYQAKASAIIASLKTLWDLPGADQVIAVSSSPHGYYDEAGYACRCLIRALTAKGATVEVLKGLTPPDRGNPKDCVLVARAWLKDQSVRDEMKRVIMESEMRSLAEYALAAFAGIATREDKGFLSDLAEDAPWSFETTWQQKEVLKKAGLPADRYYPIRDLAKGILYRLAKSENP